jgi:hypothetical protein
MRLANTARSRSSLIFRRLAFTQSIRYFSDPAYSC